MNNEEPITMLGMLETLNFIKKNKRTECIIQFHKRETHKGTLSNEYQLGFDQFERPRPSKIIQVVKPSAIMHNDVTFTLESHRIVDLAMLASNLRCYADAFKSNHYYFQKEAAFKHYDQNAAVSSCSIPFALDDLPKDTKVHKLVFAPSVKQNKDYPNS